MEICRASISACTPLVRCKHVTDKITSQKTSAINFSTRHVQFCAHAKAADKVKQTLTVQLEQSQQRGDELA